MSRNAINIADLRQQARRRLPRMVFDYIDGGAEDEITLASNEARFREIELAWRVLRDVSHIDTTTKLLGQPLAFPAIVSPTASSRLFNPRAGEPAVARAAAEAGIVYCASTLATTPIEDVAASAGGPKWFQVYMWKDRGLVAEILSRAAAAGFQGVILTVDTPVAGNRERDPRNRFTIPPKINLRTAAHTLSKPSYLLDLLLTPPLRAANFTHIKQEIGGIVDFINNQFDRSIGWNEVAWLRSYWKGAFAIKGVALPADARECVNSGADAVWISNHGGRQLDTAAATIDLLPAIADQVSGKASIILDGGIRRGSDIVKALAMGAQAVALGRACLWGLAADGEAGVANALRILMEEMRRAMALLGCTSVADITPDVVFRQSR